jgi:hypothetical protein
MRYKQLSGTAGGGDRADDVEEDTGSMATSKPKPKGAPKRRTGSGGTLLTFSSRLAYMWATNSTADGDEALGHTGRALNFSQFVAWWAEEGE